MQVQIPLADKHALVCGASAGIGLATAQELARLGANITLLARNQNALEKARDTLPNEGKQHHDYVVADAAEPDTLTRAVQTANQNPAGPVLILVNNTGGPPGGPVADAEPEEFVRAFRNHLLANHTLVQAALPAMKQAGFGRIINIISTSVLTPIAGLGVSNTTRGAVANWAKTLAGELAPLGITVNNVLPGYTDTNRLTTLFEKKAQRLGTSAEKVLADTLAAIPMQRLGSPNEIGAVAAFLATPAAAYLTGVNIPVDGGRTAIQ